MAFLFTGSSEFVGTTDGVLDMDVFSFQPEVTLAISVAAAFALGLLTHRLVQSTRHQIVIKDLTDDVRRLEQQKDAAHQATLDLAADHTKLVGDHHEAEWMIRKLENDLRLRDARIESLTEDFATELPSINDEFWIVQKSLQ